MTSPQPTRQIFLLGAVVLVLMVAIGLSSKKSDLATMTKKFDRHKVQSAQAQQQLLNARGLEIVTGSLHESSNPSRECQEEGNSSINFAGLTSIPLSNGETVKVRVTDCHPCNWPPTPQQDMTCTITLVIESSLTEPVVVNCFIGDSGKDKRGEFIIYCPKDQTKRAVLLTLIKDIAGTKAAPTRAEFNHVLRQAFGYGEDKNKVQTITELVILLGSAINTELNKRENYGT